eukprot:Filipodium_phascolosomae@DN2527_c0_g1_i3.p1
MVSLSASRKDPNPSLYYFRSNKRIFAFLEKGPFFLVLYAQLISILTKGIDRTLEARPGYDVRQLLGGSDSQLSSICRWTYGDVWSLLDGYETLPLDLTLRHNLMAMLDRKADPCIIGGLMMAEHRVVAVLNSKFLRMKSADVIVVVNLLYSNASLRKSESWTPLCLPHFNSNSFLTAYINFVTEDVSLVYFSSTANTDTFYSLSQHFQQVTNFMVGHSNVMKGVFTSMQKCPVDVQLVFPSLELIHLVVYSPKSQQFVSAAFAPNYYKKIWKVKRILRAYHLCQYGLQKCPIPAQGYLSLKHETVYIEIGADYHLYFCVPAYVSINSQTVKQLSLWVQSHSSTWFFFPKI